MVFPVPWLDALRRLEVCPGANRPSAACTTVLADKAKPAITAAFATSTIPPFSIASILLLTALTPLPVVYRSRMPMAVSSRSAIEVLWCRGVSSRICPGRRRSGSVSPNRNSFDELMQGVIDSRHIGQGVVDGVECEHLAFRNADTDWQIWVETGTRPTPRKYVITSKAVAGAPQYTLRIKDWKTDAAVGADAFAFKAAADATKVTIQAMRDFDEVPAGVPVGGKK